MPSNFAQAKELLEHAWLRLSGDDEFSALAREALELLIEGVATKAHAAKSHAQIIEFRRAVSLLRQVHP